MKTGKQIRILILDLLSDGKEHSMPEIRNYVLSNNIILDESSTLIRNIMHQLKKEYPNLVNLSRGIYQLLPTSTTSANPDATFNEAILTIEKTLQECTSFNWYSCSASDLEIARIKVHTLQKLAKSIMQELK